MDTMIGRTIAKYRVIEQIGGGGASAVYKAYQPGLDRYVAIKILSPYHSEKPEFGKRFAREARAIARLHHPNIVPIYDFGDYEGLRYIAMRYVEGSHTLKEEMERPISLSRVLDLTLQVAGALDHAHQHGVVHRDVKPSNILVDGKWALLTDFGLAKTPDDSGNLTRSGISVGTPAYMSPEQGQGLPLDHRTDIYSLGTILYEIFTGDVPHNAETPFAIVLKRATEPPSMPHAKYQEVTDAVKQVVLKALAIDPADRFQSAGAFACALRKAVVQNGAESPVEPERTTRPTARPSPNSGNAAGRSGCSDSRAVRVTHHLVAGVVALMLVVVVALLVTYLVRTGVHLSAPSLVKLVTPVATATHTIVVPHTDRRPVPAVLPTRASAESLSADNGFLYKVQAGGLESVYVASLGGGDSSRLTGYAQDVTGAFCSNGRRIIVKERRGDKYTFYMVDTDGEHQLMLVSGVDDGWVHCSDDGRKVMAAWRNGAAWDSIVMDPDGSRRIALVSGAADYYVSWDRRWRTAATSLKEGDQYALYLAGIDGGQRRDITRGTSTAYSYYPAISPDGRWLIYRTYRDEALFNLYLVNTEDNRTVELAKGVVYPQGWFSPSGDRLLIAMMPGRDAPFKLHVLDIVNGRSIALLSGDEVGGQFASAETWIAAYARRDGTYHLYVADADGSNVVQPVEPGDYAEWQGFSADGRWALASVRRGGFFYLYRVSSDGLQVSEIVGERQGADWYADGFFGMDDTQLLVQVGRAAPSRSSLYRVALGGAQWTELARGADWQLSGAFTADGEHIIFDSNRDGRRAIYLADADGHNVHWLENGFAPVVGPTHRPAGRHHPEPVVPQPTVDVGQVAAPARSLPVTCTPTSAPAPTAWEPTATPTVPSPELPPTALPTEPSYDAPLAPPPTAVLPTATISWFPPVTLEMLVPSGANAAGQPITVGLRNTWGASGETHVFECDVRAPDSSTSTAQGTLNGDSWSYLTYPTSFIGARLAESGEYQLRCEVEGQEIENRFFMDERVQGADVSVGVP